MRKIILAIAMVVGLLTFTQTASAGYNPLPTNYTTCAQTAFLGARVCVDPTTGYGPIVYIYVSSTTLVSAFPFSSTLTGPAFWVPNVDWYYNSGLSTQVSVNGLTQLGTVETPSPCTGYTATPLVCVAPPNHDYLEWYSNVSDYEFTVVY